MAPETPGSGSLPSARRLLACAQSKIKCLADTPRCARAEPRQHRLGPAAKHRMGPARRDLHQRHQNEAPLVQNGVREHQPSTLPMPARPVEAPPSIVEHVDIERPCLHGWGGLAPRTPLDSLGKLQQASRSQPPLGYQYSVQISRLPAAAHRDGPVYVRSIDNGQTRGLQFFHRTHETLVRSAPATRGIASEPQQQDADLSRLYQRSGQLVGTLL
jgi:hypothetical protein